MMMISYPRVDRTTKLAGRFANRCVSIDPFELYQQHGWLLFSSDEIQKITGMQDPFGVRKKGVYAKTYRRFDDVCITIYDEAKDSVDWTLMHEIGHIILGHFLFFRRHNTLDKRQLYRMLENEADIFASIVLERAKTKWILEGDESEDRKSEPRLLCSG